MTHLSPIVCPLSGNPDITLIEKIRVNDIVYLYKKLLAIDVTDELRPLTWIGYYRSNCSDLRFFYPAPTGSPYFYEALQRHAWYYDTMRQEFTYMARLIQPSEKVLEIGCGTGVFTTYLSTSSYTGLEFNNRAITQARARGLSIHNESIQTHALRNESEYDFVCAFQVLEHVNDIVSFLEASLRCLKPGGKLAFSVPSAESFLSRMPNNILNIPPHHVSHWTEQSFRYVAERFGLKILEIRHEPLAPQHRQSYLLALILGAIRQAFHRPHYLIDTSQPFLSVDRLLRKISRFIVSFLLPKHMALPGHSIYAVYIKP